MRLGKKPMKKQRATQTIVPFIFGLAMLVIAGCFALPQISVVEGQERDKIIALGEPLADALFQGLDEENYTLFSRDFDSAMKKALDENAFHEMVQTFSAKIGRYQSRDVEKVEMIDTLYVITYQVTFENENPVSMRLSLRLEETLLVAGLYFDSPKLREE
jgi:hypothetical protein